MGGLFGLIDGLMDRSIDPIGSLIPSQSMGLDTRARLVGWWFFILPFFSLFVFNAGPGGAGRDHDQAVPVAGQRTPGPTGGE
jgi:hypothetical protein